MWIRRKTLLWIVSPLILAVAAAYLQWLSFGLPTLPTYQVMSLPDATAPSGFPVWIRVTHLNNFIFLLLIVRAGLQILMDHPRLYWNIHCTPGTEWIRFTKATVPLDRPYTSKDDARALNSFVGLPGGWHTLGLARHWHFTSALLWVAGGLLFIVLLFATNQWQRLVPISWRVFPDAWAVFVHYVTFHLPPEPDGYFQFNALQQLAYFGVVFVLAPLAILTGPSMSPALVNRFKWYPMLPGNRQIGRSIHFLVLCAFLLFVVAHVTMVVVSGFARNMNHIVLGTDDSGLSGVFIGFAAIGGVVAVNLLANWVSNKHPRIVQHVGSALINPIQRILLDRHPPQSQYSSKDISPYFWANGKMPGSDEWKKLAAHQFAGYRLKVHGQVDNPVSLSLEDLRALGKKTQITLHHCIQGWSGIAEWGGLPMAELIKLVHPKQTVKSVVFYSYGEGGEGGQYYDSHDLATMLHSQSLLAYEMNGAPLSNQHGAPLRLRVENQLGFKMVKWIQSIEFVDSVKPIFQGEGGYDQDNEFFNTMANI